MTTYRRDDSVICSACNGSGEGRYDGTTCRTCRGSGELPSQEDEEARIDRMADRADYLNDLAKDEGLHHKPFDLKEGEVLF